MKEFDEGELSFGPDIDFIGSELRDLYQDVRNSQALFDQGGMTINEMNELQQELDMRWPYMNKPLKVTGNVRVFSENPENPEEYTSKTMFVEDQPLQSKGFIFARYADKSEGEETFHLVHYFCFPPVPTQQNIYRGNYEQINGFADIDEVSIEYPFEKQSAILEKLNYFFPNATDQISDAILASTNESEAVMSLADITIPFGKDNLKSDLDTIAAYANLQIEFDTRMPYEMQFNGLYYDVDNKVDGNLVPQQTGTTTTLAYPIKVDLIEEPVLDDNEQPTGEVELKFGLRIKPVHENRKKDDDKEYVIPITKSLKLHDSRSLFYISINTDEEQGK